MLTLASLTKRTPPVSILAALSTPFLWPAFAGIAGEFDPPPVYNRGDRILLSPMREQVYVIVWIEGVHAWVRPEGRTDEIGALVKVSHRWSHA